MDPQVLMRFAQCLASNEKKYRDRAVAKLKKWLETKCGDDMTDGDLMKVWKGLHYCMWMSDKPLVQEELAERLSKLIHLLPSMDLALRFVECFLWTEIREWHGIDSFRIDKFMMLIRLYWRESLQLLKKASWSNHGVLIDIIGRTLASVDDDRVSDGLRYYMIDIFWDELTKIGAEELEAEQVTDFLDPFCMIICNTRNKTLMNRVIKEIFEPPLEWVKEDAMIDELLAEEEEGDQVNEEASDEEDEEDEETEEEEEEEEDGEESDEKMELNGIEEAPSRCQVDLNKLAERLFELASDSKTPSSNRTRVYGLVKKYKAAVEGKFTEKVLRTVPKKGVLRSGQINQAAESLMKFEKKLMEDTRKGKKRKLQDDGVQVNEENNVKKQKKGKENQANGVSSNAKDLAENSGNRIPDKQTKPSVKQSEKKKKKTGKEPVEEQTKNKKKQSPKSKANQQKAMETVTPKSEPKKKKSEVTLDITPKSEKKSKVKKSAILDGALETSTPIITAESSIKKAKKLPKDSVEDNTPKVNKKKKEVLDRLSLSPKNSAKKSNSSFANFDSTVTPPAAFVKKAVAKTEPKKTKKSKLSRSESMNTPQTNGKKRVSFIMARNTAQEFEDSFNASPAPFNPFILPENGILKPSPVNSPVLKKKKVITRRRSTAADFF